MNVINEYNEGVMETIRKVSKDRGIPIERFSPKDKDGIEHTLGLFELDGLYSEFIHQGAKKYAYRKTKDNSMHITVSGVPKQRCESIKKFRRF
jgi:hypothetical protein